MIFDNHYANGCTVRTPSFPSRIVDNYATKDNDDVVSFILSPAVSKHNGEIYQIIAMRDEDFISSNLTKDSKGVTLTGFAAEKQISRVLTDTTKKYFGNSRSDEIINPVSVKDGVSFKWWKYEDSNMCYISNWISDNGNPIKIDSTNYSEGHKFINNGKVHFFTICAVKDSSGSYVKSTVVRHTAVMMDPNEYFNIINPGDIYTEKLCKNKIIDFTYKVRLTGDLKIKSGYTVNFKKDSGVETTRIPSVVISDNDVHIIVEGILNAQGYTQDIFFGPSKIVPGDTANSSLATYKDNGIWGGIYILKGGELNMDKAIISGAYDGLVLYNNDGTKINLTNTVIKYNEIGMHLYDSYPAVFSNVVVMRNYLYGVKEDNMSSGIYSKKNAVITDAIIQTNIADNFHINYYDFNKGIIK